MEKPKKIVITGGHAGATAYATVEAILRNSNVKNEIYFVGANSSVEDKIVLPLEAKTLPKLGVKYISIKAGRIQRKFTRHTIPSLFRIPLSFFEVYKILSKIRPDVLLSFGGYVSFPVVIVAKLLGIPVVLHEQTSSYGRANKAVSFLVDKIALARESSLIYFGKEKSEVIGNPISDEIKLIKPKSKLPQKPTILITGGSRGAEVINNVVSLILPKLLRSYNVLHQVGEANKEKYIKLRTHLGDLGRGYEVYGIIESSSWFKYLEKADIVISRSGANIVSEILASKRPSILIPIPWSFADEQYKNAVFAKNFGIADILKQEDLTPENLLNYIKKITSSLEKVVAKVKEKQSPDIDSADRLAQIVLKMSKK